MLTINYSDVAIIARVIRKHAEDCEQIASRSIYLKKHYEDESDQCYRLAREFNEIIEDQAKRIAVTYDD